MNLYSSAMTLFLVLNPLGNIPVFITTLQHVEPTRRYWVIFRECLFALLILLIFLFAGQSVIKGLQVSEPALGISGGIILFLIAIRLIFPQDAKQEKDKLSGEPFLVPLAIPLVAGPATMATLMLLSTQYQGHTTSLLIALLCAWAAVTGILLSSTPLSRLLGLRGLTALERLMGMILTTLAVQMFMTGVDQFFNLST